MKTPYADVTLIADRLCDTALIFRGTANWVGRQSQESPSREAEYPQAASLGPDIYGGAAGIAWFLLQASDATGGNVRWTSIGMAAIRGAMRRVQAALDAGGNTVDTWPSFYSGGLGPAWLGYRYGTLLGEQDVVRRADDILRRLARPRVDYMAKEILGVHASAMPTYLWLEDNGWSGGLDAAKHYADELVAAAVWEDERASWAYQEPHNGRRGLTGFSHGASGYAAALQAMALSTGEEDYSRHAVGALQYEASLFDAAAQNWPDLRRPVPPGARYPCSSVWCHGAAGMGLARSAMDQLRLPWPMRAEISIAMERTTESVKLAVENPASNMMLCHGLMGNLVCLDDMASLLEDVGGRSEVSGALELSLDRFGVDHEARANRFAEWPTGHFGHTELSLFKGIAGVGWALLRLTAASSDQVLLVPGLTDP